MGANGVSDHLAVYFLRNARHTSTPTRYPLRLVQQVVSTGFLTFLRKEENEPVLGSGSSMSRRAAVRSKKGSDLVRLLFAADRF